MGAKFIEIVKVLAKNWRLNDGPLFQFSEYQR